MSIVIASAVFPPEPVVSAQISADLAAELIARGHHVTVICPRPSRPKGIAGDPRTPTTVSRLKSGGAAVIRVRSYTHPDGGFLGRMAESASFGLAVTKTLFRVRSRTAVIYLNVWPVAAQAILAFWARVNGCRFILHIQDLYPESLRGKVPGGLYRLVAPWLTCLDRWIANGATTTVVVSEQMAELFARTRRIDSRNILVCENWHDEVRFMAPLEVSECKARYGVSEGRFTFLYLGNIGPVAGVDLLIRAFEGAKLAGGQLVIAGDGSEKDRCVALTKELGVDNVVFISDPEIGNVPAIQAMADVCLLPLKPLAGVGSVPSKLPAYMFSAKPILCTADAEAKTARCVIEARCGWVGPAGDAKWLSAMMRMTQAMPAGDLGALGKNGRDYALLNFTKVRGVGRLAAIVAAATEDGAAALRRLHRIV